MRAVKYSEELLDTDRARSGLWRTTTAEVTESYDLVSQRRGQPGRTVQEGACHRPGQSEDLRVGLKVTKLKAEVHQLRGRHEFLKCSSLACEGTTSATKVLARARNAKALV